MKRQWRRAESNPSAATVSLEQAFALADRRVEQGRWKEVVTLLEPLQERFPGHQELLTRLCRAYLAQEKYFHAGQICKELEEFAPGDPETLWIRGCAHTGLEWPLLAQPCYEALVTNFPDHPEADEAHRRLADTPQQVEAALARSGLAGPDALATEEQVEQALYLFHNGHYDPAAEMLAALMAEQPDFTEGWIALANAQMLGGHIHAAEQSALQALRIAPQDSVPLCQVIFLQLLNGRTEEAESRHEYLRLLQPEPATVERLRKQAEALALLRDWPAVIEINRRLPHPVPPRDQSAASRIRHLAAVSEYKLGHEAQARRLWTAALEMHPDNSEAKTHLEDFHRVEQDRDAPWVFELAYWLHSPVVKDTTGLFNSGIEEEERNRFLQQLIEKYPELCTCAPLMLEMGDHGSRQWVMMLADATSHPALYEALRGFATGKLGSLDMRRRAAVMLHRGGFLDGDSIVMWIKGEWRPYRMQGFRMDHGPIEELPEGIEEAINEAIRAYEDGRSEEAEALLRGAISAAPNCASPRYFYAKLQLQSGNREEGFRVMGDVHARFPDFSLARITLASHAREQQRFDDAEALLEPVVRRGFIRPLEFAALCEAQFRINLDKGEYRIARGWIRMWGDRMPGCPGIKEAGEMLDDTEARRHPPRKARPLHPSRARR